MTSTTETWELSSLAHKLDNINSHLRKQLTVCRQHLGKPIKLLDYFIYANGESSSGFSFLTIKYLYPILLGNIMLYMMQMITDREKHLQHFGSFLRHPIKIIRRFSKLCFAARMIRCHCLMVLPNKGLTLKPFSLPLILTLNL